MPSATIACYEFEVHACLCITKPLAMTPFVDFLSQVHW